MMDILSVAFRWIHIVAGIIWIGLLYWFNFVNIPFSGTMDSDSKKKVVPELLPRALYWFRWGAIWTWATGVLLLLLVFYHGGLMFEEGEGGWNAATIVMIILVFGMFFVYDVIARSAIGKNHRTMAIVGFALVAGFMYAMIEWAEFSYRAYVIHVGATFGTIMMMNVWMRIWPAQKKVIPAIKEGQAPDADLVALAGQRSRHNVFMSVPLVWTMINQHTVVPGGSSPLYLLGVILLAWLIVPLLYKRSTTVKGF